MRAQGEAVGAAWRQWGREKLHTVARRRLWAGE